MLTATYTLVALSVEQASLRLGVAALQDHLQARLRGQPSLSAPQLGEAWSALQRVVDTWQWRQLDMFLLPVIRRVTADADRLLFELDELHRAAADAIAGLVQRAGAMSISNPFVPASGLTSAAAFAPGPGLTSAVAFAPVAGLTNPVAVAPGAAVDYFCAGIDAFCAAVLARLEREERDLFAIARSVIPVEAWFAIANQMLVHEAIRQENKPARRRPGSELPERRATVRGDDKPALRIVPDRRAAPRAPALALSA
jgi:hypothetical protein